MEMPGFVRKLGRPSSRRTSLALAAAGLLGASGIAAAQADDQPAEDAPPPVEEEHNGSHRKRTRCIRCPAAPPTVQYVERSVACYGTGECTAIAECPSPLRAVSCQFGGTAGEVAPYQARIYSGRTCVVSDYDVSGEIIAQVVCM